MRPNSARVCSAIVLRSASEVTSVGTTLARRPKDFTSAAVRSAPDALQLSNDDVGSHLRQFEGRGTSDATPRTSDNRNLSF